MGTPLQRCPTQPVPVIRQNPKEPVRDLSLVRWGLIPSCSWATDPSISARMINARSETVSVKPAFRDGLKSRRCLIPADGFYEWSRTEKAKQPYCFEVNAGELFAFAGIWDRWKDASGKTVETCSQPEERKMFEKQLDQTYGHKHELWEAAKAEARRVLVERANAEDLIRYGELSLKITAIRFEPDGHDFHHLLGQLSWESDAAGEGMISVLVCHKEGDQLPGNGFFSLAKELGRDVSDRVRCWSDETKRVYRAFCVTAGQR